MQKKATSISREQLLDKLRSIASELGKARLTCDEFVMHSSMARSVIYQHFDGWTDACQAAGLEPGLTMAERPKPQEHSDEACIKEIQRVAYLLGARLTSNSFTQYACMSATTVRRRFGGWDAALKVAGLTPRPSVTNAQLTRDCVREMQRVAALRSQSHLTRDEFKANSTPEYFQVLRKITRTTTWHALLNLAGLSPSPAFKAEVPIEKLANDFLKASIEIGKIPTLRQVTRRSEHADHTFAGKHGGYSAFKWLAIQHLFSSNGRIPPAIKEAFQMELASSATDEVTSPGNATTVTTKVEISQDRIVSLVATLLSDWHPSVLKNELGYSNSLASYLRAALPDDAQVDREYRHEGTTCDIRIAYRVADEVFLELKWQLRKKAECDRLIGQVEGLKPSKNKIIVVLVGETNQTLHGRLKAQFSNYLCDQRVGEERFMVVHVPMPDS